LLLTEECCIHGGLDCGIYFRTGISFRGGGGSLQIKLGRISFPPRQLNSKNLLALCLVW